MTAPIRTVGSNNWRYRTGYQHKQRVPMPIQPLEPLFQQQSLWTRLTAKW